MGTSAALDESVGPVGALASVASIDPSATLGAVSEVLASVASAATSLGPSLALASSIGIMAAPYRGTGGKGPPYTVPRDAPLLEPALAIASGCGGEKVIGALTLPWRNRAGIRSTNTVCRRRPDPTGSPTCNQRGGSSSVSHRDGLFPGIARRCCAHGSSSERSV